MSERCDGRASSVHLGNASAPVKPASWLISPAYCPSILSALFTSALTTHLPLFMLICPVPVVCRVRTTRTWILKNVLLHTNRHAVSQLKDASPHLTLTKLVAMSYSAVIKQQRLRLWGDLFQDKIEKRRIWSNTRPWASADGSHCTVCVQRLSWWENEWQLFIDSKMTQ